MKGAAQSAMCSNDFAPPARAGRLSQIKILCGNRYGTTFYEADRYVRLTIESIQSIKNRSGYQLVNIGIRPFQARTMTTMMVRRIADVLILLPLIVRCQDEEPVLSEGDDNTPLTSCNCTGCRNSDRVSIGLHKNLVSDICPEGSVATVTTLRTANTKGGLSNYDLLTWNEVR